MVVEKVNKSKNQHTSRKSKPVGSESSTVVYQVVPLQLPRTKKCRHYTVCDRTKGRSKQPVTVFYCSRKSKSASPVFKTNGKQDQDFFQPSFKEASRKIRRFNTRSSVPVRRSSNLVLDKKSKSVYMKSSRRLNCVNRKSSSLHEFDHFYKRFERETEKAIAKQKEIWEMSSFCANDPYDRFLGGPLDVFVERFFRQILEEKDLE